MAGFGLYDERFKPTKMGFASFGIRTAFDSFGKGALKGKGQFRGGAIVFGR